MAGGYKSYNGSRARTTRISKIKAAQKLARQRYPRSMAYYRSRLAPMASNISTRGFMGIELKFLDTANTGFALLAPTDAAGGEVQPGVGATGSISAMAQGDGEQQRDGRKCTLKSVYVSGRVDCSAQANQTAGDNAAQCFIALVLDTQTNAATVASENVFANQSAAGTLAANPMRNLEFSSRFRILATDILTFDQPQMVWDGTNVEQAGLSKSFKFFKKLNIPVVHNTTGTTANVSTITDNSLHIIAYTSSTSLAPNIRYNARVRFVG